MAIINVRDRKLGGDDVAWGMGSYTYTDANGVVQTTPEINATIIPATSGRSVWDYLLDITPVDSTAKLVAALTALGSTNPATIYLKRGSYALTSDLTVPSNIQLWPEHGAIIDADNYDLVINGPINAGPYQIFDWGTGTITLAGPNRTIWAEWFGASTSLADNGPVIQKAYDSFDTGGGTIQFGSGTFVSTSAAVTATTGENICFKGQGRGWEDLSTETTGTTLKYTGTGIFMSLHPSTSIKGWCFRDIGIWCSNTGSAIELGDTSTFATGKTINYSSFQNVMLQGTGGDFGLGAMTAFYLKSDNQFTVRGFKYGIWTQACDGARMQGTAWLNNQNIRCEKATSGALSYGADCVFRFMMSVTADYGADRYLIYDTASLSKYEHGQYETSGGGIDQTFYLNGSNTIFDHCPLGDGGVIGSDATQILFTNCIAYTAAVWTINAPATYDLNGATDHSIYVKKPGGTLKVNIPVNPRVVYLDETGTVDEFRLLGGNSRTDAATHSLMAFMGNPGPHVTNYLVNPMTKGHITFYTAPTWEADADATTGWAFKLPYSEGGGPIDSCLIKRFTAGTTIEIDTVLAMMVRYRTSVTPDGGNAVPYYDGSVLGTAGFGGTLTSPDTTYKEITLIQPFTGATLLTAGERLDVWIQNNLTIAGAHTVDLYIDYMAVVPYAPNIKALTQGFYPLAAEPTVKYQGMIALADRTNWDPCTVGAGGPYFAWYNGSAWARIDAQ